MQCLLIQIKFILPGDNLHCEQPLINDQGIRENITSPCPSVASYSFSSETKANFLLKEKEKNKNKLNLHHGNCLFLFHLEH